MYATMVAFTLSCRRPWGMPLLTGVPSPSTNQRVSRSAHITGDLVSLRTEVHLKASMDLKHIKVNRPAVS